MSLSIKLDQYRVLVSCFNFLFSLSSLVLTWIGNLGITRNCETVLQLQATQESLLIMFPSEEKRVLGDYEFHIKTSHSLFLTFSLYVFTENPSFSSSDLNSLCEKGFSSF